MWRWPVACNITPRIKTASSVVWAAIPLWTTEGVSGPDQRTPDLSAVIQESSSSAPALRATRLSVIIFPQPITDNAGERTAISFEMANGSANFQPAIFNVEFRPIPEPSTCVLAALAAAGLCLVRRRRQPGRTSSVR
jgi:hypothetical protein